MFLKNNIKSIGQKLSFGIFTVAIALAACSQADAAPSVPEIIIGRIIASQISGQISGQYPGQIPGRYPGQSGGQSGGRSPRPYPGQDQGRGHYPGQDQGGYGQIDYQEATQLVNLLYQAVLFRRADPYALRTDVDRLMQEGAYALGQIAYDLGESDEFANSIAHRYSAQQIVNRLYSVLLNRRGDAAGVWGWVSQIQQRNYGVVMQGFVESDEFRNLHNL
jgi:hypothetical protein